MSVDVCILTHSLALETEYSQCVGAPAVKGGS